MTEAEIHIAPLSYAPRLRQRPQDDIDLVVIHCTELPDLATAREYGERILYPGSGTGNSGHYYVERFGRIEEWVPPDRIAHHVRGHNERSIGIELDNPGRFPDWLDSRRQRMSSSYPDNQLESLATLLEWLCEANQGLRWITGHEHLDRTLVAATDDPELRVRRKTDPGPLFPWKNLLEHTTLEFLGE